MLSEGEIEIDDIVPFVAVTEKPVAEDATILDAEVVMLIVTPDEGLVE